MNIPYLLFKKVTNNFSEDRIIGSGGFGNVYKGELDDGELIAVKMLHPLQGLNDEQFQNEVCNILFKDGHPNIIGLLGYCDEIHSEFIEYHGKKVSSKHVYRGLCSEYFPSGSLHKHLVEQSLAPDWSTRYSIIKGICEGLNFLHGCKPPIYHLDLKPDNILLDSSMVPKLADFGLSRLFAESHTHVTERTIGTDKYMPPEYRIRGAISSQNDVFSFGVVMIEIMEGYSLFQEMDDVTKFKEEVVTKWSCMTEPTSEYKKGKLIHQVRTCIDTAMHCMDYERKNRPTIARILDTLTETETDIPRTQLEVVPHRPTTDLKNSLAETLNTMNAELENIANSGANTEQVPDMMKTSSYVDETFKDRETSSYVEEGLIIGRTEEKRKILSILSESSTKEMVILPIYGIGGIGKTTLAQLIFNDTQLQGYSRVWVYVSEKLNINTIGNSIISQLSKKTSHIADMQTLHDHLAKLLVGKRILIVLDDLWEKDLYELDKLKAMLRIGQGKKVIIVTTRDEAIAKNICSTIKNVPYKLDRLTDDMCWKIIKQKTDFQNQADKYNLEQIGRDIAIKCGGVALAAQSIGYLLMSMCTSDQWESVRNSDIWNSEDASLGTHKVLASLRLSYSHMHRLLQSCFSYCAVFPKGHKILKYDLIHQWIALGLAQPSDIFDSMQVCEQYVIQLLGMSFLENSKTPLSGPQGRYATSFTMHDLVHDLARAILADKVNKNGNVLQSSCEYAFLTDPTKLLSSPENISALHLYSRKRIELRHGKFSPAKNLLVLDISGGLNKKSTNSIGELNQLRYLRALSPDRAIPNFINNLLKLNYLCLSRSSMEALPNSIGDMKGLMHLDLSNCWQLSQLPISFANLKQLVHLDLSYCSVPISDSWGGFTKLQYLNLSRHHGLSQAFEVLPEVIGKLIKLQYLNLSFTMFEETKVLPGVFGKLTKLRYLNLAGCMSKISEADIHSLLVGISTLYNLEHLDLSHTRRLNSIPESIGNLTKLHTLDLLGCSLTSIPERIENLTNLHTLDLSGCNIQKLPARMANMPSLKIVNINTLDECGSNLITFAAANPFILKISKLEDVKSLEEAQSIKLMEKTRMKYLSLQWGTVDRGTSFVDDKDVLEKLVPPRTIGTLDISGYYSLSFPTNWLMSGIGQYFPNVNLITLDDFPNCNNLPQLGQLPNLQHLSLHRLVSLEDLNTADSCSEVMFPKLHTLDIISCPKLRIKPCLPRALSTLLIEGSDNVLTSGGKSDSSSSFRLSLLRVERSKFPLRRWTLLQHVYAPCNLTIRYCSDLTSCSPEIIQRLSSLEVLELEDDILTELPTWLLELTSLKRLTITAPKLEKLNDSTRQLTTGLQSLSLHGCGSMVSLPQWLGEVTSLCSLIITECEGIESLPGSIRQLTKLQTLSINSCHMDFHNEMRNPLYSIPADMDEVNIWAWKENHKRDIEKFLEGSDSYTDQEDIEEESTEEDMEEHGEDVSNDVTSADAAAVADANAVALVRSPSALSIETVSAAKDLSDSPANAVNTWTHDSRSHKRRVGAAGPVTVEAPGRAEKRPRLLVPATSADHDTSRGSRINNNGTSADALTTRVADVVADETATDDVEDPRRSVNPDTATGDPHATTAREQRTRKKSTRYPSNMWAR